MYRFYVYRYDGCENGMEAMAAHQVGTKYPQSDVFIFGDGGQVAAVALIGWSGERDPRKRKAMEPFSDVMWCGISAALAGGGAFEETIYRMF